MLRASDLKNILHEILIKTYLFSINITGVICDGAATNRSLMTQLFNKKLHINDAIPTIMEHPVKGTDIVAISDPPHAIKKLLNSCASKNHRIIKTFHFDSDDKDHELEISLNEMYNLFLLFQKDGTLQRFKDFKPKDFFPNALTQMHVGRSHRCLGSPMLDMIDTAIEFSNEYHSEVNKPENEKDIAKIDALQKWKGLNEELQCMKEVVGWTSSIIDILNDRSFKLSNNPNCPESVRRIKLLRDALIWFIDWRDRAIIDSKSRDLMEQYSIFFTKNSTDDLIQVLQGTLNLLEINTKEITLLDGSTYWSYILLKGVSQDRLANHFIRIRSISVIRLHQR
jgi:hypothetical protein